MVQTTETGCCPRFQPEAWDGKEVTWEGKPFVRDRVRSLFHIPLNFGGVMRRNMQAIEAADACDPEGITLSGENSLWGADVFIAVKKDVPGLRLERISGTFLAEVHEGHYGKVQQWCKDLRATIESEGRQLARLYFWYTTCPKCAKAYGKNYVVLLAERSAPSGGA